ncbi:unnamed protein product, partial [Ilex paraguariensis]
NSWIVIFFNLRFTRVFWFSSLCRRFLSSCIQRKGIIFGLSFLLNGLGVFKGLSSKASYLVNAALSNDFSNLPPLIRSDFSALSHHLLIRSASLVPFEDNLSNGLSAR